MDMDGTLLNGNNEVSEGTQVVLKEAAQQGVNLAIATGRIYTSARKYAELLGIEAPIIACNGALIRNRVSNEVIYHNEISKEDAIQVIKIAKAHNIYFHFYGQEKLYVEEAGLPYLWECYWGGRNRNNEKIDIEEIKDAMDYIETEKPQILKFVLVDQQPEKLIAIRKELEKVSTIEVDKSWHNNLEIMNKGVSKGKAISQLSRLMGIKKEEVIAFGDNYNDLSMKDYSGAFVAMGNSEEEVKKAATFLTTTNNEDGVAEGIKKYVLSESLLE